MKLQEVHQKAGAGEVAAIEADLASVLEVVETGESCELVAFHGSPHCFSKFDPERCGESGKTADEPAFFFCDTFQAASDYAEHVLSRPTSPTVVQALLQMRSVLVVDGDGRGVSEIPIPELLLQAQQQKYQGLVIRNVKDGIHAKGEGTLILVPIEHLAEVITVQKLLKPEFKGPKFSSGIELE